MLNKIAIALFSIAIGIIIGSAINFHNIVNGALPETTDHSETHNLPHGHGHEHKMVEYPEDLPVPSISLTIHEDQKSGWNLQLQTQNIEIAPHMASGENMEGMGHAHLYIDGDKITRLYGEWFHLPPEWLATGEHEIKVTLSSNNHEEYMLNGAVISDSKQMTKTEANNQMLMDDMEMEEMEMDML